MSAIQWSDVKLVDAALDAVSAGARALILEYVNEVLNTKRLGGENSKRTRTARVFMAAHLGEMWRRKNDATADKGEVASETISGDSLSLSYATGAGDTSDDALQETEHGRAFISIARSAYKVGFVPR